MPFPSEGANPREAGHVSHIIAPPRLLAAPANYLLRLRGLPRAHCGAAFAAARSMYLSAQGGPATFIALGAHHIPFSPRTGAAHPRRRGRAADDRRAPRPATAQRSADGQGDGRRPRAAARPN
eukprot:scaffold3257_cov202-Prasinococcus_capsulatus_cf.AAC.1